MRIIGGTLKGRVYKPKADKWPTRPTTDIAKEGLYNILQNRVIFSELNCLDLFGGTGSHTYELASRGVQHVTYVDRFRLACKFVAQTCETFAINELVQIKCQDVFQFLNSNLQQFNFIFAGPPYDLKRIPDLPNVVMTKNHATPDVLFVLEHNANHSFEQHKYFVHERHYGGTFFSFFQFEPSF